MKIKEVRGKERNFKGNERKNLLYDILNYFGMITICM
jgi:hypothetical protein